MRYFSNDGVQRWWICCMVVVTVVSFRAAAWAQQMGSIRGTVYDRDFDVPLAAVEISIAETGAAAVADDEGNFVFGDIPP
ncbi:MAG: carboxypeptidase-like regulatory domain-containing protein, partial [Candidatus Omnitrophica bacterium]|nr:carboxypeptidase-like regulatory domain-containing protein [Candidatus Omnitrophota bacterium]